MSTDQLERKQEPAAAARREAPRATTFPSRPMTRVWLILALIVVVAAGIGGFFFLTSAKTAGQEHGGGKSESNSREPRVQVVKPEHGGMQRTTEQPGTVRAFEYAKLYTKISGFVDKLYVDRGSPVKKGQVLAEIYDPERNAAVDQSLASLEHAKAAVEQAEANIRLRSKLRGEGGSRQAGGGLGQSSSRGFPLEITARNSTCDSPN